MLAAIRASSRARFAATSVENPPTHRGLLTPRTSVTRMTYDHVLPRRITPLRNLGADPDAGPGFGADFGTGDAPAVGIMGRRR